MTCAGELQCLLRDIGDQAALAHNHLGRAFSAALRLALLLVKGTGLGLAHLADKISEPLVERRGMPVIAADMHPRAAARRLLRWKGML